MKSDSVKKGVQQAPHRSLFNALGFTKEEMDKPLVGLFDFLYQLGQESKIGDFTLALRRKLRNHAGNGLLCP